jgi:hypothetical protein
LKQRIEALPAAGMSEVDIRTSVSVSISLGL